MSPGEPGCSGGAGEWGMVVVVTLGVLPKGTQICQNIHREGCVKDTKTCKVFYLYIY